MAKFQLDTDHYPPFDGFPPQGLKFLRSLKKNNNRAWFAEHKGDYEEFVKFPMQSLIAALKQPIERFAPDINVDPGRALFRIYRDTRFSKNKQPYKTHVAAVLHPKGHWSGSAGYYVHIEPGNIYVGGGIYMPDGDQLKKIRSAIAERSAEISSIIDHKSFRKKFGTLQGDKLHRAPLGYPSDHPMLKLLKYKSFYTGVEWAEKVCYSSKFIDRIVVVYEDLSPLVRFLNEALGGLDRQSRRIQ